MLTYVDFSSHESLDSYYFPKKFGTHLQKGLIFMCTEINFHNFYIFELRIHFLAEEDFLNMHSDCYCLGQIQNSRLNTTEQKFISTILTMLQ